MLIWLAVAPVLLGQEVPTTSASQAARAPTSAATGTVLFIGNSLFYAHGSPVRFYRAQTVTDLNGGGVGGVPALFKFFTEQAGLNFTVSLETVGAKDLYYHLQNKREIIGRPWDYVVMQSITNLDHDKPGDPASLVRSAKQIAEFLHSKNPRADIRLVATWARADEVYPESGHWHGRPVEAMAKDIRAGYDLAAASTPFIHGVVPVGDAWNRAIKTGFADPNPYDGIAPGQIDLWTYDHHHASALGYYLEALMIFGDLTGLDPRSLGKAERAAFELGFSPDQTIALQQVAYDELSTAKPQVGFKKFTPINAGKD